MRYCKYVIGDKVKVKHGITQYEYIGFIVAIDAYGSFFKREMPAYTIKTDSGKLLMHVPETEIEPI